ncbi:hypothetical protein [Pseudonocardia ailaonensis]|uniref:RraA family protein n=1 Tax=Pseudonocardia ailaonensis TaxID=367279 RepID=UPI0031E2085C
MTPDDTARGLGVATIAASLRAVTGRDGVIAAERLPRRSGSGCVVGRARTASNPPGENSATWPLVGAARAGDLLVLAGPDDSVALWGHLASTAAAAAGVTGVLVDGGARDVGACREMGFSVFARAVVTRDPAKRRPGVLGEPIRIGEVVVGEGDVVVADDDGVVVVPAGRWPEVLAAATERGRAEERDLEALQAGRIDEVVAAKAGHLPGGSQP